MECEKWLERPWTDGGVSGRRKDWENGIEIMRVPEGSTRLALKMGHMRYKGVCIMEMVVAAEIKEKASMS